MLDSGHAKLGANTAEQSCFISIKVFSALGDNK